MGKAAADEINKYFCNIGADLEAKLPTQSNNGIYPIRESGTYIEDLNKITLKELMKEIKSIDVAKSSGFKDISTKILKTIFLITPLCLLHIMNRCIETNIFPECWKVSQKHPKKGHSRLLKKEIQDQPGYTGTKLNVTQDDINAQSLDMVYRIGKFHKKADKPRNILVSLVRYADRQKIMHAKALLKYDTLDYYVNEDLSAESRVHRATMKQLVKSAKELDYDAKISGNKLIIDGDSYDSNDFDIIPGCILRNCRQEKHFQDGIAYKGERSAYSNFFFQPFILGGKKFISVEQNFQFAKAKYFGYHSIFRKIMCTANPFDIKTLGRRIENVLSQSEIDEWDEQAYEHLYDAVYAKFSQNRSLCLDLLGTEDRRLMEATTDFTYGCGIDLSSNKWEDGTWTGENLAGCVVMDVRDQLKEEGFEEALNSPSRSNMVSSEYTQTTPCSPPVTSSNHRSLAGGTSSSGYADPRHLRPNAAMKYPGHVTGRSQARRSNPPQGSSDIENESEIDMDTSYHSNQIEEDQDGEGVDTDVVTESNGTVNEITDEANPEADEGNISKAAQKSQAQK